MTSKASPYGEVRAPTVPPITHFVFGEIEGSGALPANTSAPEAFAAVMGTLLFWLSDDQARDLVHRLPPSMRPLIERAALKRNSHLAEGDASEYIDRVASVLQVGAQEAERLARAVIGGLAMLMTSDEIDGLATRLPAGLKELWRQAARIGAPRRRPGRA